MSATFALTILRGIRPSLHHVPTYQRARGFSLVARLETNKPMETTKIEKPISATTAPHSITSQSSTSPSPTSTNSQSSNRPSPNPSGGELGFKKLYLSLNPRLRLILIVYLVIAGGAESTFWITVLWAKFSGKQLEEDHWTNVLWAKVFGSKSVSAEKSEES
jgi:hypothetical protein